MSDMIESESGLVIPGHAETPSRQQQRANERQLKKVHDKYLQLKAEGFPVADQGDYRVVRCPAENPDHPFHVMKFCVGHMRWEPMDDVHPVAAVMIAQTIADLVSE